MTADNELKNFTLIPNVENGGRKCGSSNINLAMENSVCIKLKSEKHLFTITWWQLNGMHTCDRIYWNSTSKKEKTWKFSLYSVSLSSFLLEINLIFHCSPNVFSSNYPWHLSKFHFLFHPNYMFYLSNYKVNSSLFSLTNKGHYHPPSQTLLSLWISLHFGLTYARDLLKTKITIYLAWKSYMHR